MATRGKEWTPDGDPMVHAAAVFFPVTDMHRLGKTEERLADGGPPESFRKYFGIPEGDTAAWKAVATDLSPLKHVSPDLCPILMIHGDDDEVVRWEQSQWFLEAAQDRCDGKIDHQTRQGTWWRPFFDMNDLARWFINISTMRHGLCRLLLIWVSSASFQQSAANEWNQFRGPNSSGVGRSSPPSASMVKTLPGTSHPKWACIPGSVGAAPFLTGLEEGLLQALCLDTRSGHLLWKQQHPRSSWPLITRRAARQPHPMCGRTACLCVFRPLDCFATTMRATKYGNAHPTRSHSMECPALPSLPMESFSGPGQ